MTDPPEKLPPDLEANLEKMQHEGVFFYRTQPGEDGPGRKFGIGWRPGDPNPLAEFIIRYCTRRFLLDLNGHRFWIEPQKTEDGSAAT